MLSSLLFFIHFVGFTSLFHFKLFRELRLIVSLSVFHWLDVNTRYHVDYLAYSIFGRYVCAL